MKFIGCGDEEERAIVRRRISGLDALLRAVAHRDKEAWGRLYQRLFPRLTAYLRKTFPQLSLQEAEDISADILILLWEKAPQYRGRHGDASAWRWIIRIAERHTLRFLRKLDLLSSLSSSSHIAVAPDWDDHLDRELLRQRLAQVWDGLSSRERDVLRLYFWHGHSLRQIGRALGVSGPRVHQILQAALDKLRRALCA